MAQILDQGRKIPLNIPSEPPEVYEVICEPSEILSHSPTGPIRDR